jgi:hypothetical protein
LDLPAENKADENLILVPRPRAHNVAPLTSDEKVASKQQKLAEKSHPTCLQKVFPKFGDCPRIFATLLAGMALPVKTAAPEGPGGRF